MLTAITAIEGAFGKQFAFGPDGVTWVLADAGVLQLGAGETLGDRVVAPEPIHHVAFTPDGRRVLACPNVYDLGGGTWTSSARLDSAVVAGLDEPPPRNQLAIVSGAFASDGKEQAIVTRFQRSRELDAVDTYAGPRERLLVVGSNGELRGVLAGGDDEIRAVAVSDRHGAAGSTALTVWDRASLQQVHLLEHHQFTVRALAVDPGGARLAAIDARGDVSIWDPVAGHLLASWHAHDGDGYAVAWHPGLAALATGGMDDTVRIWSTDGTLLHDERLGGWPMALAFDPAGSRLGAVTHARPPSLTFYAVDAVLAGR